VTDRSIGKVFGRRAVVLPVIHLADHDRAQAEAMLDAAEALRSGAAGVFLIDHHMRAPNLLVKVARACEDAMRMARGFSPVPLLPAWVGVNFLSLSPEEASDYAHERRCFDGVWVDAMPRAVIGGSIEGASAGRRVLAFVGVSFKYQPFRGVVEDEARMALAAGAHVLTTSGEGTGKACDPEKVRRIRALLDAEAPDRSVGVASGVSVDNAAELVRAGADALLVATSIAREGADRLDGAKLRALVSEVDAATGVPA